MFSLICVWINDWGNNREAGDLRRYRAHYDVIIMFFSFLAPIHTYTSLHSFTGMELIIQGELYVLTHDSMRFSWDQSTSWSLVVDNTDLDPALDGKPVLGLCGNMDGNSRSKFINIDCNKFTWRRHSIEKFPVLLALCEGNPPVTVDSPHKGPVTWALMFSLMFAQTNGWANNRGQMVETLWWSLWRHCSEINY